MVTSLTSTKKGKTMVRCFDRCNLIKSWKPATKRDWLFEETWRCEVTGERVERYYLNRKSARANIMRNNQNFTDLFSVDSF